MTDADMTPWLNQLDNLLVDLGSSRADLEAEGLDAEALENEFLIGRSPSEVIFIYLGPGDDEGETEEEFEDEELEDEEEEEDLDDELEDEAEDNLDPDLDETEKE